MVRPARHDGRASVLVTDGEQRCGTPQFALRATFPKKYRVRLARAKRLALSVKFAGWDDGGRTTAATQRLTIRR